jgi:hypothetical protein
MDLTAGLDPTVDEVTAETPSNPEYREGTSMWLWDDAGRVTLPRVGLESVGAGWESARMVTVNVARLDGRVYVVWDDVPPHPAIDAAGRPRVLGAGPLRFECIEPFVRWRFVFEGKAAETTVDDQIAGRAPRGRDTAAASSVPVAVDLDTRMAAPAVVQGSLGGIGRPVGEHRFEQVFVAEGRVQIGAEEIPFKGGGLRIHRKGRNRTAPSDFFGHCWQSALFPSGRAFGLNHHHPRPDGSLKFLEGWVMYEDGQVLAAQIRSTPWMHSMQPSGEDVSLTFDTARGEVHIAGETVASTFLPTRQTRGGGASEGAAMFTNLQQGTARYRWDGEDTFGMIERSYLP